MADERYLKQNILDIPDLEPERSYESEGIIYREDPIVPDPYIPTSIEEQLEVIDELDKVYQLADLLPPGISEIIKGIAEVLSRDTRGRVINRIEENSKYTEPEPEGTVPTDNIRDVPIFETNVNFVRDDLDDDEEIITDIFSSDLDFNIVQKDNPDIAALLRDIADKEDADIKSMFVENMTELTQKFMQTMTVIANDAGMPDYSYLLESFDGTAVTTNDANLQYLIDYISKSQKTRKQLNSLLNKTHTPENTLIMIRSSYSAQKQRENYLDQQYPDGSSITNTMNQDLLEDSRMISNNKYKDGVYNLYKYLDDASKQTATMLNMQINEATAKAQLSVSGSDIYAKTPLPIPEQVEQDDQYDDVMDKVGNINSDIAAIAAQGQSADTIDGGSTGDGNYSPPGGGGSDPSLLTAKRKEAWDAIKAMGYNDMATAGIMGNAMAESGIRPEADNGEGHYGIFQWASKKSVNGTRWEELCAKYPGNACWDIKNQIAFMKYEIDTKSYYSACKVENMNKLSSVHECMMCFLKWYEGALGQAEGERASYAKQFYEAWAGK